MHFRKRVSMCITRCETIIHWPWSHVERAVVRRITAESGCQSRHHGAPGHDHVVVQWRVGVRSWASKKRLCVYCS